MPTGTRVSYAGGLSIGTDGSADFEPPVEAPPTPLPERDIVAEVIDDVVIDGTNFTPVTREARHPRAHYRILVGGKDVTYFRGVQTPFPKYGLESPLLYGSAALSFPQIHAAYERPGHGALSWLKKEATVRVQRVDPDTGEVVTGGDRDFVGFIADFQHDGRDFTCTVGGQASGRANLQDRPLVIFPTVSDIGTQVQNTIQHSLRLPIANTPTTGIEMQETGGAGSELDWLTDILAKSTQLDGEQWSVMPNANGYRMARKDTTTIDATAYIDGFRVVESLKRDFAEEPNRIWAEGVNPDGKRIRFAIYPGLALNPRPTFPGTLSPGDSGDGVDAIAWRLFTVGYLDEAPFSLTWSTGSDPLTDAIKDLQDDADLSSTGVVNLATWNAIFDPDVTGFSTRRSSIKPAAQRAFTQAFLRNASGQIIGANPKYDRTRIFVDASVDMGTGFTRRKIQHWAQRELADDNAANWVGTITVTTGAVIDGEHNPGDAFSSSDLRDVRSLKPGQNLWLPNWDGGTLVHISGVTVSNDACELAVDTRARDTMKVWEVIHRNRESRKSPARQWIAQNRRSGIRDDTGAFYDGGSFGRIERTFCPDGVWTVVASPAGRSGTLSEIDIQTDTDHAVFGLAVWGQHVTSSFVNRKLGNPFGSGYYDHVDAVQDDLFDHHGLIDVFGDVDQPCGYGSRMHTKKDGTLSDAPITGRFRFKAGAPYFCHGEPVLYLAIRPDRDCYVQGGRVMDLLLDDATS